MDDWVDIRKDEAHVTRERAKARALRESPWWKEQLAKGLCQYCSGKFPSQELTMDHVIPVARGGRSTKSNVVPCCKSCNSKKKCLTPAEQILWDLERSGELGEVDREE